MIGIMIAPRYVLKAQWLTHATFTPKKASQPLKYQESLKITFLMTKSMQIYSTSCEQKHFQHAFTISVVSVKKEIKARIKKDQKETRKNIIYVKNGNKIEFLGKEFPADG